MFAIISALYIDFVAYLLRNVGLHCDSKGDTVTYPDKFVGLGTGMCQQKFSVATVKCRKFRHFGHIMRGEDKSLEKGIIEGTLPGNRKRGRPKTAWIDNVTSWTGLKLKDTIRKVDNRSAWRTTTRQGKARKKNCYANLQNYFA